MHIRLTPSEQSPRSWGRHPLPQSGRECPGCQALAYPADRYCACCGTRLDGVCTACGSPIAHPVANYCTHCGVPVDSRSTD